MEENNSVGGAKLAFGNASTTKADQIDSKTLPVEEVATQVLNRPVADTKEEESADVLSSSYTDERTVSIALVKNFSLYRKVNDKVLPKKKDFIGSSVSASRILSSNKEEIETYFPPLLGIAPNNPDFITRVKQYLNNIRIGVDELDVTFNTSFVYKHKADYYKIKAEEEKIDEEYSKVDRKDLAKLKIALKDKLTKLNILEGSKYNLGYPVVVEDYLMYRHCLLYGDVAKDLIFINSDSSIRFYFKDDQKEADKQRKFRTEVNKAKTNYVAALADDVIFDAVYAQYLVLNTLPVISGLAENRMMREDKLDKFSAEHPIKFNAIFNNKDVKLIGAIELLIARGELQRSQFNQNISSTDGQFIGANIKEAVLWFKNPENSASVDTYYNKLKNI